MLPSPPPHPLHTQNLYFLPYMDWSSKAIISLIFWSMFYTSWPLYPSISLNSRKSQLWMSSALWQPNSYPRLPDIAWEDCRSASVHNLPLMSLNEATQGSCFSSHTSNFPSPTLSGELLIHIEKVFDINKVFIWFGLEPTLLILHFEEWKMCEWRERILWRTNYK